MGQLTTCIFLAKNNIIFKTDATKFYQKSNSAAGTRLRKAYLQLKNLASAGRNEVAELKCKGNK